MTLEEARKLMEEWPHIMGYCDYKNCEKYKGVFYSANDSVKELINQLLEAASLIAASEQREIIINILEKGKPSEAFCNTSEYMKGGRKFLQLAIEKFNSQQNISSKNE